MFKYFTGRIYSFDKEPEQTLPEVNFPAFNPTDETPTWLLIHLDFEKLPKSLQTKIQPYYLQTDISIDVLKVNVSIDLDAQLSLAKEISNLVSSNNNLVWRSTPDYDELAAVCGIMWDYLFSKDIKKQTRWIRSARQLAFYIKNFEREQSIDAIIRLLRENSPKEKPSVDEAIEGALEFVRVWMSFILPKFLRAVDQIQKDVLKNPRIDYSFYSDSIENLFLPASFTALEEYGIPLSVAQKLRNLLPVQDGTSAVLKRIKSLSLERTTLTKFEKDLVQTISKTIT